MADVVCAHQRILFAPPAMGLSTGVCAECGAEIVRPAVIPAKSLKDRITDESMLRRARAGMPKPEQMDLTGLRGQIVQRENDRGGVSR